MKHGGRRSEDGFVRSPDRRKGERRGISPAKPSMGIPASPEIPVSAEMLDAAYDAFYERYPNIASFNFAMIYRVMETQRRKEAANESPLVRRFTDPK